MISIRSKVEECPRMKALSEFLSADPCDSDRKWAAYVALCPDLTCSPPTSCSTDRLGGDTVLAVGSPSTGARPFATEASASSTIIPPTGRAATAKAISAPTVTRDTHSPTNKWAAQFEAELDTVFAALRAKWKAEANSQGTSSPAISSLSTSQAPASALLASQSASIQTVLASTLTAATSFTTDPAAGASASTALGISLPGPTYAASVSGDVDIVVQTPTTCSMICPEGDTGTYLPLGGLGARGATSAVINPVRAIESTPPHTCARPLAAEASAPCTNSHVVLLVTNSMVHVTYEDCSVDDKEDDLLLATGFVVPISALLAPPDCCFMKFLLTSTVTTPEHTDAEKVIVPHLLVLSGSTTVTKLERGRCEKLGTLVVNMNSTPMVLWKWHPPDRAKLSGMIPGFVLTPTMSQLQSILFPEESACYLQFGKLLEFRVALFNLKPWPSFVLHPDGWPFRFPWSSTQFIALDGSEQFPWVIAWLTHVYLSCSSMICDQFCSIMVVSILTVGIPSYTAASIYIPVNQYIAMKYNDADANVPANDAYCDECIFTLVAIMVPKQLQGNHNWLSNQTLSLEVGTYFALEMVSVNDNLGSEFVQWEIAWTMTLESSKSWFPFCSAGPDSLYHGESFQWTIAWFLIGSPSGCLDFGGSGNFSRCCELFGSSEELFSVLAFPFFQTTLQVIDDDFKWHPAGIFSPSKPPDKGTCGFLMVHHIRLHILLLGVLIVWPHFTRVQLSDILLAVCIDMLQCTEFEFKGRSSRNYALPGRGQMMLKRGHINLLPEMIDYFLQALVSLCISGYASDCGSEVMHLIIASIFSHILLESGVQFYSTEKCSVYDSAQFQWNIAWLNMKISDVGNRFMQFFLEARRYSVTRGDYLEKKIAANLQYFAAIQRPWDPGGSQVRRLEDKPNFKVGGLSATLAF